MDAEDIVDQNGFSASRRRFFRSRSNGLLGLLGKTGPEEPKEQGEGRPPTVVFREFYPPILRELPPAL